MISWFTKSVTWLGIGEIAIKLYYSVAIIYIANLLSPRDFALMGVAMLIISFLDLTTEIGLGEAVVQRKNISEKDKVNAFWIATIMGTMFGLICFFLSEPAEAFFEKTGVSSIIKMLSVILLLRSISIVPYKLIQRKMRFKLKAIIDTTSRFLSISSSALFAYLGYGVWSLVYAQVIYFVFITILSFAFEPFRPRLLISFRDISDMIVFGLNIIGLRYSWALRNSIDSIVAGKFLNEMNFGFYSFAFKLADNVRDVIHRVATVISLPLFSKLQNKDKDLNYNYLLLLKYITLSSFPIFIGGIIFSKTIIELFFSAKWMPIIGVFKVACFVQILRLFNCINENMFIAIGKPRIFLIINLLTAIFLGSSFLWSLRWGMKGLLLAWIIVFPAIIIGISYFIICYRRINISSYFKSIIPAILATTAMYFVVYPLKILILKNYVSRFDMAMKLILLVLIGGAAYIGTIYLIDKTIISLIFKKTNIKKEDIYYI